MGELDIMAKVGHHPNIVNLIGASEHMGKIWDVIKQNESEVGSAMFLVSEYFYTSNICQ